MLQSTDNLTVQIVLSLRLHPLGNILEHAHRMRDLAASITNRCLQRMNKPQRPIVAGNMLDWNLQRLRGGKHMLIITDILLGVIRLVEWRVDQPAKLLKRHAIQIAKCFVGVGDPRFRAFDQHHFVKQIHGLVHDVNLLLEPLLDCMAGGELALKLGIALAQRC